MEKSSKIVKKIEGFDYLISSEGDVFSMKHHNTRLVSKCKTGSYVSVQLYDSDGAKRLKYVHRLTAEAFLPNPLRLRFVVHKNGNKFDNRVENLAWSASKTFDKSLKGEVWKVFPHIPDLKVSNKGRVKHKGYVLQTFEGSDGRTKVTIPFHGIKTVDIMTGILFSADKKKKKPSRRKLNDDQVAEIKRDYQKGKITMQFLAEKYGVSKTAIHQIIVGKSFLNIKPKIGEKMDIKRPEFPHEAMSLIKSGFSIEIDSKKAIHFISYFLENIENAKFSVQNGRFNDGFALIEKIN